MYFLLKSSLFRGHSLVFGGVKLTITSNEAALKLALQISLFTPLETQQQVPNPTWTRTVNELGKKNTTTELNSPPPVLFGDFLEKNSTFSADQKRDQNFLNPKKNLPSPGVVKALNELLVGGWTNPSGEHGSNWIISPNRDENKQIFDPHHPANHWVSSSFPSRLEGCRNLRSARGW